MRPGLVLLAEAPLPAQDAAEALDAWGKRFEDARARLPDEGALWVFARHGWRDGALLPWPYLLAERAQAAGLRFKAVLVRHEPLDAPEGKPFTAAHELVLHLVASLADYRFDKAPLREPHVYKDREWGRRSVGTTGYHGRTTTRYRPEGKDPGNVLHRARRDADGVFLAMEPYPRRALARRLALASSAAGWTVATNLGLTRRDVPGREVVRLAW
ncbi:MAG TPA: hypothetical protein VNX21_09565 [Candidatus Thermoplasmatota archaeon]|nr:hypothetical protein [Candidatus Thermoplasmatota archaeon]